MTNRVPCVEKETSVDKHNHKSDEKNNPIGRKETEERHDKEG